MSHPDPPSSHAQETQYRLTEQQLAEIEAEIKSTQPLASQLLPIAALIQQYAADPSPTQQPQQQHQPQQQQHQQQQHLQESGFLTSSKLLSKKYTHLRRIRGDGNCYYRAFLYSLCEGLLKRRFHLPTNDAVKDSESARIRTLVTNSLSWVCTLGYDETTLEMFYDELMELLDFIDNLPLSPSLPAADPDRASPTMRQSALLALHDKLNEENSTSDYCTWYLRVLTAAQMKYDPDRYLPFLLAEEDASSMMDIPTFCSREVEPMNRECGMVQVAALAECFAVGVFVEYMDGTVVQQTQKDGSFTDQVACHEFGKTREGSTMKVALLYRPGHYDILY